MRPPRPSPAERPPYEAFTLGVATGGADELRGLSAS